MKTINIKIDSTSNDIKTRLNPLIMGHVFHITKYDSYKSIIDDGFLYPNINNKYKFTTLQSEKSYGNKKGYICLIDLRFPNEKTIEQSIDKYYFYAPFYDTKKYVFMLLSLKILDKIITQKDIQDRLKNTDMYVPGVECWYPKALSTKQIEKVIIVNRSHTVLDYVPPWELNNNAPNNAS